MKHLKILNSTSKASTDIVLAFGLKRNIGIPLCIILGGAIIAASIFAVNTFGAESTSIARADYAHVYGDDNAPVRIVEFSDFECPYCAELHPTLKRVVDESEGLVVWEFRHLPLRSHTNAEEAAYAAECVAALSDEEVFFSYAEHLFQNQRQLGRETYVAGLSGTGISEDDFITCLSDEKLKERVAEDLAAALRNGAAGTPFSIIVYADGTTRPVSGALSYTEWKRILAK